MGSRCTSDPYAEISEHLATYALTTTMLMTATGSRTQGTELFKVLAGHGQEDVSTKCSELKANLQVPATVSCMPRRTCLLVTVCTGDLISFHA